ncbi:hypothetical protein ACQEVI_26770 [Promicromonospora sp. CA-289599]|uniref:oxidoreductase n=1 Tax=Promicromonospora sp. CA-289599 TaxID=3240014 RepID=UPI003D8FD620
MGSATPLALDFYRQYCRRSLGLMTIGGVAVNADGRANATSLVLRSMENTRGLSMVKSEAHQAGVRLIVQIEHAGRQGRSAETGARLVGPTADPCPVVGGDPHALTVSEITEVIHAFSRSATLALAAGADLIEINAAHGYLLSGFMSPATNRRTDQYGGNVQKRFRLVRDVVRAIADETQYPPGIRVNVAENNPAGLILDELLEGLADFSAELAYISVTAGMYDTQNDLIMPSRRLGTSLWAKHAATLRTLGVPVLLAGNVTTKVMADELLANQEADVVLFGRALLADPNILDGKVTQPCTDCGLCKYRTKGFPHIYCPFNSVLRAGSTIRGMRIVGRGV